jgi:hypothetical protein
MVSGSPARSRASPVNSISPTTRLANRLRAVWCSRTSCRAHRAAKPSLRVVSSPIRSLRPRSPGFHARAGRSSRTHPGQRGDLFTPQPRYPPLFAVPRQPGPLRGDPGPAAGQEVVHGLDGPHLDTTSRPPARGRYRQYTRAQAVRARESWRPGPLVGRASHRETGNVCSIGHAKPLLPSCDEKRGRTT